MSTKCTLAHGETFHFYREVLDDNNVYLQLETTQYEATRGRVTVQVPIHIWETIRHVGGPSLNLIDKSDADLLAMVQADVDRRVEEFRRVMREHPGHAGWARLIGCLIYGGADSPRAEQIEKGLEYYRHERQRQKKLTAAIMALQVKHPAG